MSRYQYAHLLVGLLAFTTIGTGSVASAAIESGCRPLPGDQREGLVLSRRPEQSSEMAAPEEIVAYKILGQSISVGEITLESDLTLAHTDNDFRSQLDALVLPHIGKTVTRADLRALQNEVTRLYIEAGYITSWADCVSLDADSSLVIKVTEGFIQDINIGWGDEENAVYIPTDDYLVDELGSTEAAIGPGVEIEAETESTETGTDQESPRGELPRDWQYAVNFLRPVLRNEDGSLKRPVNIVELEARLQKLASDPRFVSLDFFSRLRVPQASSLEATIELLQPGTSGHAEFNVDTLGLGASVLEIRLSSVVVDAEDVEDAPFGINLLATTKRLEDLRSDAFKRYFRSDADQVLVDPSMIRFALHSLEQQRPEIKAAVVYIGAEGSRVAIRVETASAPPIEIASIARFEEQESEREFTFDDQGRFVEETEDEQSDGIGAFFSNLFRGNNVDRDTLVTESERFWRLVQQSDSQEYREFADGLYDLLIRPVEEEFERQGIEVNTLLVAMDADLGLLPLASLYDSEDEVYLAEKYRLANILNFRSLDIRPSNLGQTQVLAMGASEFREADRYAPLTAVPLELQLIENIWGEDQVETFRNEAFTLNNLRQQRRETPYPIVHLASHANFRSGQPGDSSIQFSDTTLPLNSLQLSTLNFNNPPLELLVLSACQTALGSEEAVLGFAGSFLSAEVKSVLASLWYVNDLASLLYMMEFYRNLDLGLPKAAAVQNAQRAMLDEQRTMQNLKELELVMRSLFSDETTRESLTEAERNRLQRLALEIDTDSKRAAIAAEFTHPFYWSAYTLVGNPW